MPTQTTTQGPPEWMQQVWQQFIPGAFNVANRPYQGYQGPRVAGMSDITQGALGGVQGAMYGNPATWGGMQFLGDLISGGTNPYLEQMANTITRDATNAFQSQLGGLNEMFSNPNSFGGARHALGVGDLSERFGRGLTDSLGQLRYGAFDNDLTRRMGATNLAQQLNSSQLQNLGFAANLGNIPRNIRQQQYDTGYNDFLDWRNYPNQQTSNLANWLGLGTQGAGQVAQTQTPNPNTWSQVLGGLGLLGSGLGWFK